MSYQAPQGSMTAATDAPPNNNLGLAIASIFCCWPAAIFAILEANKVNTLWAQGDRNGAHAAAAKAKKIAMWAIIGGLVLTVLFTIGYFLLFAALLSASDGASSTYSFSSSY